MNDILINALVNSVRLGHMDVDQVPLPFQGEVARLLKEVRDDDEV